eukprot:jgi/Botrbrau1/20656/Bobra.0703s0001.1
MARNVRCCISHVTAVLLLLVTGSVLQSGVMFCCADVVEDGSHDEFCSVPIVVPKGCATMPSTGNTSEVTFHSEVCQNRGHPDPKGKKFVPNKPHQFNLAGVPSSTVALQHTWVLYMTREAYLNTKPCILHDDKPRGWAFRPSLQIFESQT